jgi:hypothetical protein
MDEQIIPSEMKMRPDIRTEYKKFFWIFPKIIAIFLNGLRNETAENNFSSFEDVVIAYISNLYHTHFLAMQMTKSLIDSCDMQAVSDPAIALFSQFFQRTYDMSQFRFFNCLLNYALGDMTPSLVSLMSIENLTPDDTHVKILKARAAQIWTAIFPFNAAPAEFISEDSGRFIGFWVFTEIMLRKFDACRHHLWAVIRASLSLSDCPDFDHITYTHFCSFIGVTFAGFDLKDMKTLWNGLTTRNQAMERPGDILDFSSITFLITETEQMFFAVMRIFVPPDFNQRFADLNAPVISVVRYLVQRLVHWIPVAAKGLPDSRSLLMKARDSIRECLYRCDASSALEHYQLLLHLIDSVLVRKFGGIRVSNASTVSEVSDLLQHFLDIEKAVGLVEVKSVGL